MKNKTLRFTHQTELPPFAPRAGVWRRRLLAVLSLAAIVVGGIVLADWWHAIPDEATATYVGSRTCAECHRTEAELWHDSHHDLAMDWATPDSVLGDFNDAELTHFGVTSRMFRRDGKYMIHTEGPDGAMADFEIKYVFGEEPLQQYMVEFDRPDDMPAGEIARLQVLRVSWDTRRKEWFYLSPPHEDQKLAPDDDFHWTGVTQRWNTMCAECHSTNLQKNYDLATGHYHTTFTDIDVSCEACHGPGSLHVQLANSWSLFWDRKRGYGLPRWKEADSITQVDMCARCHSRQHTVFPGHVAGAKYYDHFVNELLVPRIYHADGQVLDEDYVYGSFVQSKMYQKDVRCTDCHDPHTARLKHEGNQVCISCHAHPEGKYDSPAHHHHTSGTPGSMCVDCHMPATTYMAVDDRRDHSFRVPRPDLSLRLGVPNACTGCHLEPENLPETKRDRLKLYQDWVEAARSGDAEVAQELARVDSWATRNAIAWYGDERQSSPHFADTLAAAWTGNPAVRGELIELSQDKSASGIVRASAVQALGQFGENEEIREALRAALRDPDPQVRLAALGHFDAMIPNRVDVAKLPPRQRDAVRERLRINATAVLPLLDHHLRSVRIEAARVLSRVPDDMLPQLATGPQRTALEQATDDYRRGLLAQSERAGAHMGLGMLAENQGDDREAERQYRTAIRLEPKTSNLRSQLGLLLERLAEVDARQSALLAESDPARAKELFDRSLERNAEADRLRKEELPLLARDARAVPDSGAVQYAYACSLYINGHQTEAEQALKKARDLLPYSENPVLMMALLYREQKRWPEAIRCAQRLLELAPDNLQYDALLTELRRQRSGGAP